MSVCLCVPAALISGLSCRGLPHSPYSMKRALENTATYLEHVEPWAQGAGLLNIEKVELYGGSGARDVRRNVYCILIMLRRSSTWWSITRRWSVTSPSI